MTDTIPTPQSEGERLKLAMDASITALKAQVRTAADAERDYRKEKSTKYVIARRMDEIKLAGDRQAWVDAETADKRYERDLAQGLEKAVLEEVRNYRQQLSFVQTMARTEGEERNSYQYGQQG